LALVFFNTSLITSCESMPAHAVAARVKGNSGRSLA
jgi:hypothetical protein